METIKLRHFIAVCENGCNLSKASSSLFITQPALSQSISSLETELETNLFERNKGRLHLTETGTKVLAIAKEIIEKEEELRSCTEEFIPKLSIFSIEPNLTLVVTTGFLLNKPAVQFTHDYDTKIINYDHIVREGKYDMYITDRPYIDSVYESLFLLNDCEYAYVPKSSRFYGKRSAYIEEFTQERFIRSENNIVGSGGFPFRVSTYLSDIIERKSIKVAVEYLNPGVVQQIFIGAMDDDRNESCRFIPTLAFYSLYRNGTYLRDRKRLIKLKNPEMTIPYYLVYKRKHSEEVDEYLNWLKSNYNNIFKSPL